MRYSTYWFGSFFFIFAISWSMTFSKRPEMCFCKATIKDCFQLTSLACCFGERQHGYKSKIWLRWFWVGLRHGQSWIQSKLHFKEHYQPVLPEALHLPIDFSILTNKKKKTTHKDVHEKDISNLISKLNLNLFFFLFTRRIKENYVFTTMELYSSLVHLTQENYNNTFKNIVSAHTNLPIFLRHGRCLMSAPWGTGRENAYACVGQH